MKENHKHKNENGNITGHATILRKIDKYLLFLRLIGG